MKFICLGKQVSKDFIDNQKFQIMKSPLHARKK